MTYEPRAGWSMQAFQFALDPTPEQAAIIARQFGGRRKAFNWTVEQLKADIEAYNEHGTETERPSFYGMRRRWNQAKAEHCVNAETGEVWWPEVSKEAFACGVRDAVDAYWRWQRSRAGKLAGCRVGFPRFKKRGRDRDRYTITTGARLDGRRHVKIPKVGRVRLHENARRLGRLLTLGRAKVRSITVRRSGNRLLVTVSCDVSRHSRNHSPTRPASTVGVDAGVRTLATISNPDGTETTKVANPAPLEAALKDLRRLNRQRSRRTRGSRRYRETTEQISVLHARIASIRRHHIHVLTTRLAKTHGRIVIEDLSVAGMLTQKGAHGARSRRRRTADAGMAEIGRQLRYKTGWYGSELVVVDRWFPSSKTCSGCGHVQDIGWAGQWTCDECGSCHDRDVNAAINLARWEPGDVGPVGAAVKRGGDRQTGPRPADARDTRKSTLVDNSERSAA